MRAPLVVVAFATVAEAAPLASPEAQALTCPNATDTCELDVADSRRDAEAG